ncbi:hypothetical protein DEV91_14021 [Phyllobacterium brassicacearum]|nr:hypothetical protein DEV91_14021 [Phyllobacterium brassicacearum]
MGDDKICAFSDDTAIKNVNGNAASLHWVLTQTL